MYLVWRVFITLEWLCVKNVPARTEFPKPAPMLTIIVSYHYPQYLPCVYMRTVPNTPYKSRRRRQCSRTMCSKCAKLMIIFLLHVGCVDCPSLWFCVVVLKVPCVVLRCRCLARVFILNRRASARTLTLPLSWGIIGPFTSRLYNLFQSIS